MKSHKIFAAVLLVTVLAGCNMPTRPEATPTTPAVGITLTAIFRTAMAQIPTSTPVPPTRAAERLVATSTQGAEPTAVPLTKTSVPAKTSAPAASTPTSKPAVTSKPSATQAPTYESSAPFLSTPPTIDGDWTEWKKVAKEYPAQYGVYGAGSREDENDLNASYYVGWDKTYLYIAVKVRDDHYVQNATGANLYKGDSVEILLDANRAGDLDARELNGDDYQIGIAPGHPTIADGNPEVYRWFPAAKAGDLPGATVAAVAESGVYRVEAAIPWAAFGVTPAKGMRLGFAISVSDNDKTGENIQQSMVSSVPARHLTDPSSWGELLLK